MKPIYSIVSAAMLACLLISSKPQHNQSLNIIPTKSGNRTEVSIPEVSYNGEASALEIKFKSENGYDVIVENEYGDRECRQPIVTDGNNRSYQLPPLPAGGYTVRIENEENAYEGDFEVESK